MEAGGRWSRVVLEGWSSVESGGKDGGAVVVVGGAAAAGLQVGVGGAVMRRKMR